MINLYPPTLISNATMTGSLTKRAHQWIREVAGIDDCAIDATAGNGYDTLFLAKLTAPNGRVFAADIQPNALQSAQQRLEMEKNTAPIEWILAGHETMAQWLPRQWHGKVKAIMFNLGYLPGGDKRIITQPETTRSALAQSCQVLASGGRITIIAYTGHPGGEEEAEQIGSWLNALNTRQFHWQCEIPINRRHPPRLFVIEKRLETGK
ncbi:MAG: hypothetical protein AXA67_11775 [Methylothermaceae bacteria B42]|nr:MAG: hypothetical protein AXA67_11775 [Methylothermaceae bacteria B42]